MAFPAAYRYTQEHEWINVDGNQATIGITDYAQKSLGDIVFVQLPAAGDAFEAGGSLGDPAHITRSFGSPASIGTLFLTDHLLAFEVTSIILLVAAVGGVILGSHSRRQHWGSADARP